MPIETKSGGGADIAQSSGRWQTRLAGPGSATWALIDQAVVSGATFLTGVAVARLLGAGAFGRFALGSVVVLIAQNLHLALVTGPVMIVGPAQRNADRPAYLGAVIVQQAVFSVLVALLAFVGLAVAGGIVPDWQLGSIALPVALLIGTGSFSELWRHFYYATANAQTSAAIDFSRYAAQGGLLAFALQQGNANVAHVFYAMAGGAVLSAAVGGRRAGEVTWAASAVRRVAREHWRLSKWMMASTAAGAVREAVVAFAAGAMLGLTELGFLRGAQQLVMAINVPLQGLGKLAQARASLAYATSGAAGLSEFMRGFVFRYLAGIAVVLAVLALWAEPLIVTAYGASYTGSGYLLSAYAVVMMLLLFREALTIRLRATHNTSREAYAGTAGTIASLALLYPLIKIFGAGGAIGAEAVFNAVVLGVMMRLAKRGNAAGHDAGQG